MSSPTPSDSTTFKPTNPVINTTTNPPKKEEEVKKSSNNISLILYFLFGVIAAYLSWTCNIRANYDMFTKIVSAFFAFLIGPLYILNYIVFRYDFCHKCVIVNK